MPRLILSLDSGASPSSVQASALSLGNVDDAVTARQSNSVIVSVPRLTSSTRRELSDLPGVTGVFEDIQGVPLVADDEEVTDFLQRVRDLRGEENLPPVVETEPTRPGDPVADGGAITLPVPQEQAGPVPEAAGPIQNATDSLDFTGARALHDQGIRGESIISVVVDTGSCGEAIRADRQLEGADLTEDADPWTPFAPHGGMTTGIMAGDETTPGIETGFLPASDVFPIKSTLAASELMQAQDIVVRLVEQNPGKTVVVNHSWGFPQCTGLCDHPVTAAVRNGAQRTPQVIAAGNSAAGVTGCGQDCNGSTPGISGPNSLPELITVAAAGHNGEPGQIHDYSSRGGEGTVSCGQRKPDVSAPIFGTMPHGCDARNMGNGGGTSAACPQVAGAVGLLADARGSVSTASAGRGLRTTASQFRPEAGDFNGCSGAGNIQVDAAVESGGSGPGVEAGIGGRTAVALASVGVAAGLLGAAARQRST